MATNSKPIVISTFNSIWISVAIGNGGLQKGGQTRENVSTGDCMMKKTIIITFFLAAGAVYLFLPPDWKSALSLSGVQSRLEILQEWCGNQPALALGLFAVVYVVSAALSLPWATLLSLLGGALFGWALGTLVVLFSATGGATLAMLFSRLLFRDWVRTRFGKKLRAIESGFAAEGAFYLFALRLVPVFPFFLINLLMGLTPIKTGTYFLVSFLGMAPATLVYVFAGRQLATLTSLKEILSLRMLLVFACLGLLPLVSRKVLQYMRKKRGRSQPTQAKNSS